MIRRTAANTVHEGYTYDVSIPRPLLFCNTFQAYFYKTPAAHKATFSSATE